MTRADAAADRLSNAVESLISATQTLGDRLYGLPSEHEWSAMQNLAHVAEFLPFWAQRAREVAEGQHADQPYGRTPDENELRAAAVDAHAGDDLSSMIGSLREALITATNTLRAIPDAAWEARTSQFEPGSPRQTVAEIVQQRLLGHVEAHTGQATTAATTAPGPSSR